MKIIQFQDSPEWEFFFFKSYLKICVKSFSNKIDISFFNSTIQNLLIFLEYRIPCCNLWTFKNHFAFFLVLLMLAFISFLESGLLSQMAELVSLSLSVLLSIECVSWVLLHKLTSSLIVPMLSLVWKDR